MSEEYQYEAVKDFILKNLEVIKEWHETAKDNCLTYINVPIFDSKNYSADAITNMFNDHHDENIYEFFRQIVCLSYNGSEILNFSNLDVLWSSKFKVSIVSLITNSPMKDFDKKFGKKILEKLKSNKIYNWMINTNPFANESLKNKQKIDSFVTYFSFINKYFPKKLTHLKSLEKSNFVKTAELLINFAESTYKCINEFFDFFCESLDYCNIDFSFLELYTLEEMIGKIQSLHTFSKVLNSAKSIKFEKSTVKIICDIIHDSFEWNWDPVLKFFESKEEVLKQSYEHVKSKYLKLKDERSKNMMIKMLEALQFYTSNIEKKLASALFDGIELNSFISEPEVLDNFIEPIEMIINAQLAIEEYSQTLLNSYFENLHNTKNKNLEHAKIQISMLAIYFYLEDVSYGYKVNHISNYLLSFISQFEYKLDYSISEILNFFKTTFAFIPEIQSYFNSKLSEKLDTNWKPKNAAYNLLLSDPSKWSKKVINDQGTLGRLILLVFEILDMTINTAAQFNYLEIQEFEVFIKDYIAIIETTNSKLLFLFYKNINNYLTGFKFREINYEDSKNPQTIAKYFICLIRNSLTEIFKIYIENQEKSNESANKRSLDDHVEDDKERLEEAKSLSIMNISTKKHKLQESINSIVEIALQENEQIIADPIWNTFLISRSTQAYQLTEFLGSFLHKIVFSTDEKFILRQYLASHFTRLFNGTLTNTDNEKFFIEGKHRAIKLYFSQAEILNDIQKKVLLNVLYSTPVKKAFKVNNIWNDNIGRLLERTYFADIPDNLSGVTVFGGTILLHQSLSQDINLKSCALKITFIHEAAHAMRKFNKGSYNAEKKTPKSNKAGLLIGMPGCKDFLTDLKETDKNEGGKLIENAIFGAFFTKINLAQIDYINNISNWSQNAEAFKSKIKKKGEDGSKTYVLARGSHYISELRNDDCDHF